MDERMKQAYEAARLLFQQRAQGEGDAPDNLGDLKPDTVLCVAGTYDRVEMVLGILGLPHTVIHPQELDTASLEPGQIMFINCPGSGVSPAGLRRLVTFVEAGGTLVTTDWALQYVLEPAFPGILAHNGQTTCGGPRECVPIRVTAPDDPVVRGIVQNGGSTDAPVWWLEPSSYPVTILAPERVEVLIDSDEMGARYGERPIMVRFTAGRGVVYHLVSHYYLQHAQARSERGRASASSLLRDAGIDAAVAEQFADLNIAEVEAARSSAEVLYKLVAAARRGGRGSTLDG